MSSIRDALYKCMSNDIAESSAITSNKITLFSVGKSEAFSIATYINFKVNDKVVGYVKIDFASGSKDNIGDYAPYYKLHQCTLNSEYFNDIQIYVYSGGNTAYDYIMLTNFKQSVKPTIEIKKDLNFGNYNELYSSTYVGTIDPSDKVTWPLLVKIEPNTEVGDNGRYYLTEDGTVKADKVTIRSKTNDGTEISGYQSISGDNLAFIKKLYGLIDKSSSQEFFTATTDTLTYSGKAINLTSSNTATVTAVTYSNLSTNVSFGKTNGYVSLMNTYATTNNIYYSNFNIIDKANANNYFKLANGALSYKNASGLTINISTNTATITALNSATIGFTSEINFDGVFKLNKITKTVSGDAISAGTTATALSTDMKLARISDLYYFTGNKNIATLGTITTGVWNGTRLTSSYIPEDVVYTKSTQVLEKKSFMVNGEALTPNTVINRAAVTTIGTTSTALDTNVPTEKAVVSKLNDVLGDQVAFSVKDGVLTITILSQKGKTLQ